MKVGDNKASLFFGIEVIWGIYDHLVSSQDFIFRNLGQSQNYHRFPIWPLIQKIWTLSYLQLQKLKKINVFLYGLYGWLGYSPFEFSLCFVFRCLKVESQNCNRFLIRPLIQKIRTLFSPTFKVEDNKVPLLFYLEFKWKMDVMAIFSFPKILSLGISGLNHKMAIDPSYDL